MAGSRIVEALDERERRMARLDLCLEPAAIEKLAFEGGEEALAHGIVVCVADRTHRGAYAGVTAAVTELDRSVLGGFKWSSQHDLCWPVGRHRNCPPHCITVTVTGSDLDEFFSIAGYHRKHAIRRRSFRRCWGPNLDKHSVVLGLVRDEPALRAGAASGILDKTCARRSAGGRSAPRNGPLDPTKECDLDLGSLQVTSETTITPRPETTRGQFRTSLDMVDISDWSSASAGVFQASVFRGRELSAAATAA